MNTLRYTFNQYKKPLAIALVGALGAIGVTGCSSSPQIDTSKPVTITGHEYDDPDTWVTIMPVGKVMVPITNYDEEHFNVNVTQCGYESEISENNAYGCITATWEVTEQQYNALQVGDDVTYGRLYSTGR